MKEIKYLDPEKIKENLNMATRVLDKGDLTGMVQIPEDDWNALYLYVEAHLAMDEDKATARDITRVAMDELENKIAKMKKGPDTEFYANRLDTLEHMYMNVSYYEMGMDGYIPQDWEKYRLRLDDEWNEYVRLKEKFEGDGPQ